jgi:hypothetical protein
VTSRLKTHKFDRIFVCSFVILRPYGGGAGQGQAGFSFSDAVSCHRLRLLDNRWSFAQRQKNTAEAFQVERTTMIE